MALSQSGELYSWGRAEGGQLGISEKRIQAHIDEKELEDTFICEPHRVLFSPVGHSSDPAGDADAAKVADVGLVVVSDGSVPLDVDNLRSAAGGFPPDTDDPVRLKQAACGDVHSVALDTAGQVWSWGWGEFGQLGLGFSSASFELGAGGMFSKRLTPQALDAKNFEGMKIKSVACGGAFSAAIGDPGPMTPSYTGNLFLWGANEVGQCTLPPRSPSEVEVPTKARGLVHTIIRSIACGASHLVAVDVGGYAYSWGSAQYGQLGASLPPKTFAPPPAWESREQGTVGGMTHQHQPTLIQSVSRLVIMKAACGLHHSLLVSEVSSDGAVRGGARNGVGHGSNAGPREDSTVSQQTSVVGATPIPSQPVTTTKAGGGNGTGRGQSTPADGSAAVAA
jgi:alpha-tubulin suppressor-like RCC1 family protein